MNQVLWDRGDKSAGSFRADYDSRHNTVFIHAGCGMFSWCAGLNAIQASELAVALMKGSFLVEQATPKAEPMEAS